MKSSFFYTENQTDDTKASSLNDVEPETVTPEIDQFISKLEIENARLAYSMQREKSIVRKFDINIQNTSNKKKNTTNFDNKKIKPIEEGLISVKTNSEYNSAKIKLEIQFNHHLMQHAYFIRDEIRAGKIIKVMDKKFVDYTNEYKLIFGTKIKADQVMTKFLLVELPKNKMEQFALEAIHDSLALMAKEVMNNEKKFESNEEEIIQLSNRINELDLSIQELKSKNTLLQNDIESRAQDKINSSDIAKRLQYQVLGSTTSKTWEKQIEENRQSIIQEQEALLSLAVRLAKLNQEQNSIKKELAESYSIIRQAISSYDYRLKNILTGRAIGDILFYLKNLIEEKKRFIDELPKMEEEQIKSFKEQLSEKHYLSRVLKFDNSRQIQTVLISFLESPTVDNLLVLNSSLENQKQLPPKMVNILLNAKALYPDIELDNLIELNEEFYEQAEEEVIYQEKQTENVNNYTAAIRCYQLMLLADHLMQDQEINLSLIPFMKDYLHRKIEQLKSTFNLEQKDKFEQTKQQIANSDQNAVLPTHRNYDEYRLRFEKLYKENGIIAPKIAIQNNVIDAYLKRKQTEKDLVLIKAFLKTIEDENEDLSDSDFQQLTVLIGNAIEIEQEQSTIQSLATLSIQLPLIFDIWTEKESSIYNEMNELFKQLTAQLEKDQNKKTYDFIVNLEEEFNKNRNYIMLETNFDPNKFNIYWTKLSREAQEMVINIRCAIDTVLTPPQKELHALIGPMHIFCSAPDAVVAHPQRTSISSLLSFSKLFSIKNHAENSISYLRQKLSVPGLGKSL